MIGDPILIDEHDKSFAQRFLNYIRIDSSYPHSIITIGGPSGSHKTEKAHALLRELNKSGFKVKVITQDDLYRISPLNRQSYREYHGIDCVGVDELDWNLVNCICQDYRMGFPVWMPRYDTCAEHFEWVNWASGDVDFLIIEGIYANFLKPRLDVTPRFSIFLNLTPEQTYQFRKIRAKENPDNAFRKAVVQKEYKICLESKKHAKFIVDFDNNIEIRD